ncbi:MAG: cyclic nucleotide-binding domain-containing protein, partial [Deltaproteobacteria bacterium]|nr:cyclic nucleotide-binding domain-containing protein [Deltaproteobacteria bacterium]
MTHPTERQGRLRRLEIFRPFSPADLDAFDALARERWLEPGDAICREGDRGGALAIVLQGEGTVRLRGAPEHSAEVASLGAGSIVGEGAFLDPAPRSATVVASVPTVIVELDRGGFEALLRDHPRAASHLLGIILRDVARRLRGVDRRVAIELGEVSAYAPLTGPPGASDDDPGVVGGTSITPADLRACGAAFLGRDEGLATLLRACTERRFEAGAVLSHQGSEARSCFIVVSGSVAVVKSLMASERVLTTLGPGAIAGQFALVDRARRSSTLRALTPVVALELGRDAFDRLLAASSPVALDLQRHLGTTSVRQLREANRRLAAVLSGRARRAPTPSAPDAPSGERR